MRCDWAVRFCWGELLYQRGALDADGQDQYTVSTRCKLVLATMQRDAYLAASRRRTRNAVCWLRHSKS